MGHIDFNAGPTMHRFELKAHKVSVLIFVSVCPGHALRTILVYLTARHCWRCEYSSRPHESFEMFRRDAVALSVTSSSNEACQFCRSLYTSGGLTGTSIYGNHSWKVKQVASGLGFLVLCVSLEQINCCRVSL